MPEYRSTVTVDRPPEAVFRYVTDVSRWPEWRMAVTDARLLTPGPLGPGSRLAVVASLMGRSVEMELEITDCSPPEAIGFAMRAGPAVGSGTLRFEPEGAGTRVTVSGAAEPIGALRLAAGLVTRQVQAMWAEDLAALKAMLEG